MKSKNIIITGTSRGIGFELIKYFSQQGYQVLALTRNRQKIDVLQKTFKNISILEVDITKEKDLKGVSSFVQNRWQKVDILIHNAGALIHKPFFKTTKKDFLNIYKVNVFAVAELTKIMLPNLHKGSHVVAISSMGGIQGSMKFAGLSAYSSSKGAVITLMELLAEEYRDSGIAFNTLALGAVQTEMLSQAFPDFKAPVTAAEMAKYIADFSLTGNKLYNGKILQVSNSTP
ncbi:MAG: SDR family NAD(P)-dependent oxidoreductase [Flavobacteriaceae bacterium]|nr:SDR family NAD(P)-dependent oxidoreductase [Flavobacteriaceae bacterium]